MLHKLKHSIVAGCLSAFMGPLLAYGPDELQPPLSSGPHFDTALGRAEHRFAGAPINRYRLYDFYARQAEHHLELGTDAPRVILPHPGLEGGRRGHWGGTNLPAEVATAYKERTQEPRYDRLVQRENQAEQFIFSPWTDRPQDRHLLQFGSKSHSFERLVAGATVIPNKSPFSFPTDRFCGAFSIQGTDVLIGKGVDWLAPDGKTRSDVKTHGYYLNGNEVVYLRSMGGSQFFDHPKIISNIGPLVFSRQIEWKGTGQDFTLALPQVPGGGIDWSNYQSENYGAQFHIWRKRGELVVNHLIGGTEVKLEIKIIDGAPCLKVTGTNSNTTLSVNSWVGAPSKAMELSEATPNRPKLLTQGGEIFYDKMVTVAARLDADPNAKGSGYAVDDIPVPIADNPYGVPMTLSGLAFTADGSTAYLCTVFGDIWKVMGLNSDLQKVQWKRFAAGIAKPLGVEILDGHLYVNANSKILKLHDLNHDHEADFYEYVYDTPSGYASGLSKDSAGHLYSTSLQGILKFTIQENGIITHSIVGRGARNPFGIGVRSDGLVLTDASEGERTPTCQIYESNHVENENSANPLKSILYLPRGVDNSPGGRVFVENDKFGPLKGAIFGTSFGSGRTYYILRDPNEGSPQAALCLLPIELPSGACRVKQHPKNGSMFVVGLDGWGDYAVEEGSFSRIRHTGEPCLKVIAWKAYQNGISFRFNEALDPRSIDPEKLFMQQWNYIRSGSYGSPEYSVRHPDQLGHDLLAIESVTLSSDWREIFLEVDDLRPSMALHFYGGTLKSREGATLKTNVFATLNQLNGNHPSAPPASGQNKLNLVEPTRDTNGETYSVIKSFFAEKRGQTLTVAYGDPPPAYSNSSLNYRWMEKHLFQKQCYECHDKGTPHDLSSYEKVMERIDLIQPTNSKLYQLVTSTSMPPSPKPKVHPEMQKALKKWIEQGAKK